MFPLIEWELFLSIFMGQSVEFIEALMLTLRNSIMQVLANVASCNVHATRSEDYYKLPYAPSVRIH